MRTIIILILLLVLSGCTGEADPRSQTKADSKREPLKLLKISVSGSDGILINGTLVSEHEFHQKLAKLKSDQGAIWFYDAPGQASSVTSMVLDFVSDSGVNVTISHEPDFSDCYSKEDWKLVELANAIFKVARESKKSESPEKTIKAFQKASDIRRQLIDRFPDVAKHQVQLARCLNYIGMLYRENRNLPSANQAFHEARAICQQLKKEDPTGAEHLTALALAHHNIGEVQGEMRKPRKSLESHQLAVAIYQGLGSEDAGLLEFDEYWAVSLNSIGLLYQFDLRNPNKALASYQQAIAIEERLVTEHPDVVRFSANLAGTYINRAQVAFQLEDFATAETSYTKGIDTLNSILSKDSKDPMARLYLRNAHRGRAMLLEVLKKFDKAVGDWNKAIEYDDDGRHKADFEKLRDAAQARQSDGP